MHLGVSLEVSQLVYTSDLSQSAALRLSPHCSSQARRLPLLFGRKARMPVDYLFPTLHDSPHQTKMEVSVVAMQKRLKEAFAVARHLTSQEAAKQWCYYDCKARAVALQPGDVVMVCTDGFVGKWKVKD